jgi:hypothetical protein
MYDSAVLSLRLLGPVRIETAVNDAKETEAAEIPRFCSRRTVALLGYLVVVGCSHYLYHSGWEGFAQPLTTVKAISESISYQIYGYKFRPRFESVVH